MTKEKVQGYMQLGIYPNWNNHSKICQNVNEINNNKKMINRVTLMPDLSVIPLNMNSVKDEQFSLSILWYSCLKFWRNNGENDTYMWTTSGHSQCIYKKEHNLFVLFSFYIQKSSIKRHSLKRYCYLSDNNKNILDRQLKNFCLNLHSIPEVWYYL